MVVPIVNTSDEIVTSSYDENLQALLLGSINGGAKVTDAHLRLIEKDFHIEGTKTTIHCYAPTLDANGKMRVQLLAEFLRDRVIEYAIPRKAVEAAQASMHATGSPAQIIKLHEKAKTLFTELRNSGEGGELLLFALAEAAFSLTQILCKMSLKTSTSMHYHGADGVYAEADAAGCLNLYWGESKLFANVTSAVTECLNSLAPFLKNEHGQDAASAQDLFLANEFADFSDPEIISALTRFFDPDHAQSNKLRMCGIALVGFDCDGFPKKDDVGAWEEIETALKGALPKWRNHVGKRLGEENLEAFDIHFICVPMRSADEFRESFLKLLGV